MRLVVGLGLVVLVCGVAYAGEEEKKISKEDQDYLEYFVGEWTQKAEQEGKPTTERPWVAEKGKSKHCIVFQTEDSTGMFCWAGKAGASLKSAIRR